MRRRTFLTSSGLGVFGLAAGPSAARGQDQHRRFKDINDFAGTWAGSYDGRKARLTIAIRPQAEGGTGAFAVAVTFEETERGERYDNAREGRQHLEKGDGSSHILRDIELYRPEDEGRVLLKRLYLHTWNADEISGFSECDGTEYGLSFKREGA